MISAKTCDKVTMSNLLATVSKYVFSYFSHVPADAVYDHLIVRQIQSWDCGLACCSMLLKWIGLDIDCVESEEFYGRKSPLWTIELFLYLRKYFGAGISMHTIYLGVNPATVTQEWYLKNSLVGEYGSVTQMFVDAKSQNWNVVKGEVCPELLKVTIGMVNKAAIVLVDNSTFNGEESLSYTGHYVVLIDYNAVLDTFTCLNPAVLYPVHVAAAVVEKARLFPGTDQDILICTKMSPLRNS